MLHKVHWQNLWNINAAMEHFRHNCTWEKHPVFNLQTLKNILGAAKSERSHVCPLSFMPMQLDMKVTESAAKRWTFYFCTSLSLFLKFIEKALMGKAEHYHTILSKTVSKVVSYFWKIETENVLLPKVHIWGTLSKGPYQWSLVIGHEAVGCSRRATVLAN